MRSASRWVMGVLLLAVCLGTAGYAQKGKPAPKPVYRWTVELRGFEPSELPPFHGTIMGGLGDSLGAGVVYDQALSSEVQAGAAPSDTDNVWNRFQVHVFNADPLAAKNTQEPTRWLSFKNFAFQPAGMSIGGYGPYSSNADKLGPVWNLDTQSWDWPFLSSGGVQPYGQPDYQASFLNGGPHPRQFYVHAALMLAYQGPPFLSLGVGVETATEPNVGIGVWAKADCEIPNANGVGEFMDRPERTVVLSEGSRPATITRLDEDHWQLDIYQPIKVVEYGYQVQSYTQGRKTVQACGSKIAGGWWTYPVRFTLIVTRISS